MTNYVQSALQSSLKNAIYPKHHYHQDQCGGMLHAMKLISPNDLSNAFSYAMLPKPLQVLLCLPLDMQSGQISCFLGSAIRVLAALQIFI